MRRFGPLRVLVVDDSATVRQVLARLLGGAGMDVRAAADPPAARDELQRFDADVVLLDPATPRMDGIHFLGELRAEHGPPVVLCAGATQHDWAVTLRALEEGAVDVVPRPHLGLDASFDDSVAELHDVVRAAATARPRLAMSARAQLPPLRVAPFGRLIVIGASTGGTAALREILDSLPASTPPLVIAQHLPEGFTGAFAARLAKTSPLRVKEAAPGDRLLPGLALLAPGGRHLSVRRAPDGGLVADVQRGAASSQRRPSVDLLFESAAKEAGDRTVGVILTGMGCDGAAGICAIRDAGGATLAQDEATCVVGEMPRAAVAAGCVEQVVPLGRMAEAILRACAPRPLTASGAPRRGA